jgi:plastocyanin
MEYWSRRSKRIARFLWLASFSIAAGALALLAWMLADTISSDGERLRYIYIAILCLPLPYVLIYFLGSRGRPSPIRRRRAANKLREYPPDTPASARAALVWDLLPLKRRLYMSGLSASLADGGDVGWSRLEEANRDVLLATGTGFDIPILMKGGAFNFLSGELPGIGTWIAVPRKLVEAMGHEELISSLIHELFHGETGELKARRIALTLYDIGVFSTAFVIYYLAFALVMNSLPTQMLFPQLPLFALLILLFWSAAKVFSHWAVFGLFPQASCLAADEYAGKVLADPRVVARSISMSLAYSVQHTAVKNLMSGQPYIVSRFMFAPLRRGERGRDSLVARVEALRVEPSPSGEDILPQVAEMNREIDAVAADTAASHDALLDKQPGRWSSVLIYVIIVGLILGFMALSTGKNFLPVRWYLDTFSGGPNVAVAGPDAVGATVTILDTGGSGGGPGFYLSPQSIDIEVGETVTWSNQDDCEYVISGDGIPTSPALQPGDSYSVFFNHSGSYGFYCREGDEGSASQRGDVFAYY